MSRSEPRVATYCLDLTLLHTFNRVRGIGRYGAQLAQALAALRSTSFGPQERIIALTCSAAGDFVTTSDLVSASNVGAALGESEAWGRHFKRYLWRHRWSAARALRRAKVDVAHFLEKHTTRISRGYRTVVTCHDFVPILHPTGYHPRWYAYVEKARDKWVFSRADRVIAISEATRRDYEKLFGRSAGHVAVVPQGLDHSVFHPRVAPDETTALRRKHDLPERFLLSMGNLDARKKPGVLFDVARSAFEAWRMPLVVAGVSLGDLGEPERRQVAASPPGAIRFLGAVPQDEVAPLYRAAWAHVFPSAYEGFGLTVLEAMGCGCPVVTTHAGALREVAADAARIVPVGDASAMSAVLREWFEDEAARQRVIASGIERAAHFSWKACAEATLASYRSCATDAACSKP